MPAEQIDRTTIAGLAAMAIAGLVIASIFIGGRVNRKQPRLGHPGGRNDD